MRLARSAIGGVEADLERLQRALSANLALQAAVAVEVADAIADGGLQLGEPALYDAIALWLIDRQLGSGLSWTADAPLS